MFEYFILMYANSQLPNASFVSGSKIGSAKVTTSICMKLWGEENDVEKLAAMMDMP